MSDSNMQSKNGNTLSWRVGELEKEFDDVDKKIDIILTNHIPHLHEELQSLKTRVNVATIINVGAILLGAVILKYI